MCIYFWERERERDRNGAWIAKGQREKETQNPKQAPGSEPSAQSLARGSNSWTGRSWPELKWRVRHLTNWATQAPPQIFLLKHKILDEGHFVFQVILHPFRKEKWRMYDFFFTKFYYVYSGPSHGNKVNKNLLN